MQGIMRNLQKILSLTSSRHICTLSTADLNHMINSFSQYGNIIDARKLFNENPTSRNVGTWNTMISCYIKNDQLQSARKLFDQMPVKDIVSWNMLLSGLNKINDSRGVYECFVEMGRVGLVVPNEFTMSIVISAILNTGFKGLIPQLHVHVVCFALSSNVYVGSALMRGYSCLGDRLGLCGVFDEILIKDASSWNAFILSCMDLGCVKDAQVAFDMMPEKNLISWTTLVNGYINNKMIDKAWLIFSQMSERNVVSWTAMINGYVQNGKFVHALNVFHMMDKSGTRPNHFTFSIALDACAGCSSLVVGMQVHAKIRKCDTREDVILSTSLVDMYSKCGDIKSAFRIFESMSKKNLVTWNTIIGGCARHGIATRAIEEFEKMINVGVKPDRVTFINMLSACAHEGLVKEGERHFKDMEAKHEIKPEVEHYACMVDLFGRAGELTKAGELIKGMPFEPDVVVWGALLGACGLHASLELGEIAAKGIYKLEKDHPAAYSMLSKIHGEKGVWSSVIELRKIMKRERATKQKAGSWC